MHIHILFSNSLISLIKHIVIHKSVHLGQMLIGSFCSVWTDWEKLLGALVLGGCTSRADLVPESSEDFCLYEARVHHLKCNCKAVFTFPLQLSGESSVMGCSFCNS